MTEATGSQNPWLERGVWALCLLVGAAFVAAGMGKLADATAAGEAFAHFGLPAWLAVFIGTCEVAGGIGLWIPRLSTWAGGGLVIIMLGAGLSHITHNDPFADSLPAFALGVLCAFIAGARWPRALGLGSG